MTIALVALVILAIVVFAFVLEPIVRAHSDRAVLDAVALPQPVDTDDRDDNDPTVDEQAASSISDDEASGNRRLSIDRAAGIDAS